VKVKSQGWRIKRTLRGSFSAVSKPKFATKYSLDSSWRDLQDLHAFAPLRPHYFSKNSPKCLAFARLEMLKRLQFVSNFVAIFADFNEICLDFRENAEKRYNLSKFLDFNLILVMINTEVVYHRCTK